MNPKIAFAIILVVVAVLGVGYLGVNMASREAELSPDFTYTATSTVPVPAIVATSTMYTSPSGNFTLTYPSTLSMREGDGELTQEWGIDVTDMGTVHTMFELPRSFQPNTNFSQGELTIGSSDAKAAVSNCLKLRSDVNNKAEKVTINGLEFTTTQYVDAAAGNRYDVRVYRTIHEGQCFSISMYSHYGVLENYDSSMGITAYDADAVQEQFDIVIDSFKFN